MVKNTKTKFSNLQNLLRISQKLLVIIILTLLLSVSMVQALTVYDLRTPDSYLVYGNNWDRRDRLDCDDNECYDYYRISRYGHKSSFGYEHFITDHLRYYNNYDSGYTHGYRYGYVDGRQDQRFYNQIYTQRYNQQYNQQYNQYRPGSYNNYGNQIY